jgi:hypothetical protein
MISDVKNMLKQRFHGMVIGISSYPPIKMVPFFRGHTAFSDAPWRSHLYLEKNRWLQGQSSPIVELSGKRRVCYGKWP